jgi:hypothetical protein
MQTLSPILNICYDIFYGDMINFNGCMGSKKTSTSESIMRLLSGPSQIGIYLNSHSYNSCKKFT